MTEADRLRPDISIPGQTPEASAPREQSKTVLFPMSIRWMLGVEVRSAPLFDSDSELRDVDTSDGHGRPGLRRA